MMVAERPENADQHPRDELGPELRRAVEEVLSRPPPEDLMRRTLGGLRRRRPKVARAITPRLALLGALVAAASIAMLVWLGRDRHGGKGNGEEGPAPPQRVAVGPPPADQLPTLWAYHRASLQSPEALEKLLDEHAAHVLASDSEPLRIGGFLGFAREPL